MLGKHLVAALTATAILGMPVPEARAGNLAAGIAGAIIGGALVSAAQRKKRRTTTYRKVRKSSYNRQENREIQTSLNYFSFPAGTPDGALGRRSRQAISSYQAFMGYPVTGHLSQYEKEFLLDSYHQAQAGGSTTSQLIASNGQGVRGLLLAYRDQRANGGERNFAGMGSFGGLPPVVAAAVREIAKSSDPTAEQLIQRAGFVQLADINKDGQTDYILDTSVTGSAFWCNQQSCAVRVFASTPDGYQRNDFQAFNVQPAMFKCLRGNCEKIDNGPVMAMAPAQQAPQQTLPNTYQASTQGSPVPTAQPVVRGATAPASGGFSIPSFGGGSTTVSMNNHCNKISLITNTNGGFTNASTMQDPVFALNEQFCLARIYAISQSEEMIKQVQGITATQMQAQCETLGPAFKEQVSALSLGQRDQVIAKTSDMILSTGMSPAQLTHTAKICLGVGYRTDNADVALASTLILVTLGEPVYGELLGHHLLNGFGTSQRKDLAVQWYAAANNAIEMGMPAVFVPGQTDRPALIQTAVARLSAPVAAEAAPTAPQSTGFVVPTFGASSN